MRRRFFSGDSKIEFNTDNYLTIEALEDGLTVEFSKEIEYGINGIGWSKLRYGSSTPPINTGQTISFRGELESNVGTGVGVFLISNRCNLSGNCMSILFGNNATDSFSLKGKESAFFNLFRDCPIVSVSGNFLPATTLAYGCYNSMFSNCTSLTTAPALPATTLANYCYHSMFRGCSKLNYIKMLATNISAYACLGHWVYGVASSGTFVKHPDMTSLPTGVSGIPSGWTVLDSTFPTNEEGYPESTEFSFPLYFNCTNYDGEDDFAIYYSRPSDEISMALYRYLMSLNIGVNEDYTLTDDEKIFCNRIPISVVSYVGMWYEGYYENIIFTLYTDGDIHMSYYK